MTRRSWAVAVGLGAVALVAGCGREQAPSQRQLDVVVTTTWLADLIGELAPHQATVTALVAAGSDPRDYQPSPADLERLAAADLVFAHGLGLEDDLAAAMAALPSPPPCHTVGEMVDPTKLLPAPDGGGHDPHVWLDPLLCKSALKPMAEALGAVDPRRAHYYRAYAAAYQIELEELDAEIRRRTAEIPAERRLLVDDNWALAYFAAAYGFTVAPAGESGAPPLAGELYLLSLGPEGSPEATYIGAMRRNLKTIVSSLKAR